MSIVGIDSETGFLLDYVLDSEGFKLFQSVGDHLVLAGEVFPFDDVTIHAFYPEWIKWVRWDGWINSFFGGGLKVRFR